MSLQAFLSAILGGSFALGPTIFMVLERIPQFGALSPELKRWVVALVSGVVGILAWGLSLYLGYIPRPEVFTPVYVAESVWASGIVTGLASFASATLIHGHLAMRKTLIDVTLDSEDEIE